MDIRPPEPAAPRAAPQPASSESGRLLNADFEMYLKMLTTQMENQDPLNPMAAEDFAAQLAQFSAVEQQVRTNQLLEGLAAQMGAGGLAEMAGWVGMEARVAAPAAFDGSPLVLHLPEPPPGAASAQLVVRDASGAERQRLAVDPSAGQVDWAGTAANGAPLPAGTYAFELAYTGASGDALPPGAPEVYADVVEVRLAGGAPQIVLAGGAVVAPAEVTALRR